MRRCLIAIFALHFFLSVSAFAFGSLHGAPAGQARAGAVLHAEAAVVVSVVSEDQVGADTAAPHALVDELPELPDSLPRIASAQRPPVETGPTIGYRQRAALPPSLDGLLRPPQQAFSAA
ncbi:MAG: hypothetical protein QUV35_03325 [Hydrogenophaga sp.]|uniref:hypothetical protein n=1 Tax=Hydrogenophaga sp. TaxID=1904254 RepID=UPI0026380D83|nr:hypothetical protein [Hydrogenophaga sp.]MDM7941639.1 hypothetical protein [Hydrogenophaga sp.]